MTGAVIFYIIIAFNNPIEAVHFEHRTENLAACLYEAHEFLSKPSHELLIRGGNVQVGCVREFAKSEEH
jgi:hypothetical protein